MRRLLVLERNRPGLFAALRIGKGIDTDHSVSVDDWTTEPQAGAC